jgi:hypothetical protein
MSEFCAGVKILLERMKSNPEDFELLDYDASLMHSVKGRFYDFAQAVEGIVLGKTDKDRPWKDWQYFTKEERQALIDGFKEMKRAKFDKKIMERVFDEQYVERQREALQLHRQPQYYHPSHQPPPVHPLQQGTFITTTDNTSGGLLGSIGLGGIFK